MACVGPGEERDTVSCPFGGNMMGGAREGAAPAAPVGCV